MAGDVDPEDKTEEPTEKRLSDAVEQGETPLSREAPLFASLCAALIALLFIIPDRAQSLLVSLVGLVDDPAGWRIERGEDVLALAGPVVIASATFLLPTVVLLMSAGLLASAAQNPPRFVPHRILPDVSRISLRSGAAAHLRGARMDRVREERHQAGRGGRGRRHDARGAEGGPAERHGRRPGALPQRILDLCVKAIAAVLAATLAVAAADLGWSQILWRRDHRMSRQELKEELRQAEGDRFSRPACARCVSTARAGACCPRCRARRWWSPTPPITRSRCAMCGRGGAPVVSPRARISIALKIRAIAEEHRIPVVEDKPLARSLYAAVEVDAPDSGRILPGGRRNRASDPAREGPMGSAKALSAAEYGARPRRPPARERIIADALVDVASELRLTDAAELMLMIHNDHAANIADLVNSSTRAVLQERDAALRALRELPGAVGCDPGRRDRPRVSPRGGVRLLSPQDWRAPRRGRDPGDPVRRAGARRWRQGRPPRRRPSQRAARAVAAPLIPVSENRRPVALRADAGDNRLRKIGNMLGSPHEPGRLGTGETCDVSTTASTRKRPEKISRESRVQGIEKAHFGRRIQGNPSFSNLRFRHVSSGNAAGQDFPRSRPTSSGSILALV